MFITNVGNVNEWEYTSLVSEQGKAEEYCRSTIALM